MATEHADSLSDYIRTENAKEREAAGLEGPAPPLPVAETLTTAESAQAEVTDAEIPAPEAEVAAAPETRNADGTFKPKKDAVQARIDKAVKAHREEQRRADAAEAKARDLEARLAASAKPVEKAEPEKPPAPVADGRPTLDQWVKDHPNDPDPLTSFSIAAAEWVSDQRDKKAQAARDQAAFQDRRQDVDAAGREQFQDWQEVISSDFGKNFVFPPHLFNAIFNADQAPALIHYLGTHPDEARALAAEPLHASLVSLGTLSARLAPARDGSGTRPVVHSKAKPLTKPLRGSTPSAPATSEPDPETTSLSDWIKLGNARDRRRAQESRGA